MSADLFTSDELVAMSNVNARITDLNSDISTLNGKFPVSVANGGTGQNTLSSGEILLGNGTSGISSTSCLSVSKGGTGVTSLTSGDILLGNGTNGISSVTTLPITSGGTGATTASSARTNLNVMESVQLYYNASGTTGTVELSQSIANFQIIEIFFWIESVSTFKSSVRIFNGGDAAATTSLTLNVGGSTSSNIRLRAFAGNIDISADSITRARQVRAYITGTNTSIAEEMTTDTPKIYKVIGYKY